MLVNNTRVVECYTVFIMLPARCMVLPPGFLSEGEYEWLKKQIFARCMTG